MKLFSQAERPELLQRREELGATWEEFMHHDAVASVCWDRQYEEYPGPAALARRRRRPADRGVERRRDPVRPGRPARRRLGCSARAGVRGPAREGGLGDRDLDRGRPPRGRAQQDDARRDAEGGRSTRPVGSRRPGAAEPEAPLPARADRALRRVAARGREAARSVAARARGRRREAGSRRAGVDADLRHGRGVGGLDEARSSRRAAPMSSRGALEPVEIDRERDEGVYIEPNVWMHHRV